MLARACFKDEKLRQLLKKEASIVQQNLQQERQTKWEDALKLANSVLKNQDYSQLASLQKRELTEQDLLKCYLHANLQDYRSTTNLDALECQSLPDLFMNVFLTIELQQTTRLLESIADSNNELIANVLMSQNKIPANQPALMLFQEERNVYSSQAGRSFK